MAVKAFSKNYTRRIKNNFVIAGFLNSTGNVLTLKVT